MQPGDLPASSVLTPTVTVTIAGRAVEVESVSITRELSTDVPGAIVGGGGITAATGSCKVIPASSVQTATRHPWAQVGGLPPVAGAPTTVDIGFAGTTWRSLTGTVDSSTGTFGASGIDVKLVDGVDAIRRVISIPVRLAPASGNDTAMGRLASVLAYGGYSAGAQPTDATILHVPLLGGSLAPSVGANATLGAGATGGWASTSWGTGYRPTALHQWQATAVRSGANVIEYVFDVDGGTTSSLNGFARPASTDGLTGPGAMCAVSVGTSGLSIKWYSDGHEVESSWYTVPPAGRYRVVTRLYTYSGTTQRITGYAYDPAAATPPAAALWDSGTYTLTSTPPISLTGDTTAAAGLGTTGTGPAVSGLRVDRYDTTATLPPAPVGGTNLVMVAGFGLPASILVDACPVTVSPAIYRRSALEAAKEIASAILAAMWIDEYGVMQVWGRGAIRTRPVAARLTSTASLLDLAWTSDAGQTAHTVAVARQVPAVTAGNGGAVYGQTIFVAQDTNLGPGQSYSEIIHPDDNTDWIEPDLTPTFDPSVSAEDVAQRDGSWYGVSAEDGSVAGGGTSSMGVWYLDDRSIKYEIRNFVNAPTRITNRIPLTSQITAFRGSPTPIIRAKSVVTWTDGQVKAAKTGPAWAPDVTHDGGRWLQAVGAADYGRYVADSLAALYATGAPTVDGIDIVPDPRLQLGDRVTVTDDARTGLVLDGLVSSINLSASSSSMSMSIGLRVISATGGGAQVQDFDAAWGADTYSAVDSYYPKASAIDADPTPPR